jgi:hypothetical protein
MKYHNILKHDLDQVISLFPFLLAGDFLGHLGEGISYPLERGGGNSMKE